MILRDDHDISVYLLVHLCDAYLYNHYYLVGRMPPVAFITPVECLQKLHQSIAFDRLLGSLGFSGFLWVSWMTKDPIEASESNGDGPSIHRFIPDSFRCELGES